MDTFKAVTWNVYWDTGRAELEPILAAQRQRGVSLFLIQEASAGFWPDLMRDAGLQRAFNRPEHLIAWDPDVWVRVAEKDVRLSDIGYRHGPDKPEVHSEAATAILCDHEGRSLLAASYHTPSKVQYPEGVRIENRYRAMVESMRTLGHLADDFEGAAVLFGGDDNWDENTGVQSPDVRPYLLGEATGLRQVQAPTGTLGRRQIDDFRIKRGGKIKPVRDGGWTAPGGGDHRLHGRKFKWRG